MPCLILAATGRNPTGLLSADRIAYSEGAVGRVALISQTLVVCVRDPGVAARAEVECSASRIRVDPGWKRDRTLGTND